MPELLHFDLVQSTDAWTTMPPLYVLKVSSLGCSHTRGYNNILSEKPSTEYYRKCFEFQGVIKWNGLPKDIKQLSSNTAFKIAIIRHIYWNLINHKRGSFQSHVRSTITLMQIYRCTLTATEVELYLESS